MVYIPWGVAARPFPPPESPAPSRPGIAGLVGRHGPGKGLDHLPAASRLARALFSWRDRARSTARPLMDLAAGRAPAGALEER